MNIFLYSLSAAKYRKLSSVLVILLSALCLCAESVRELRTNSGGRVRSFDPIYADDLASRDLAGAVFDTLVEYDYTARPYKLKPSMLEKMPETDKSFTKYSFKLRDDLFFAPVNALRGTPEKSRKITSRDVKYSLLRLADSRLSSPLYWLVRNKIAGFDRFHRDSASAEGNDIYERDVAGFTIHDDLNFTITLTSPDPLFLYRLALPNAAVVPKLAVENRKINFSRHPAGSGAFSVESWISDYKITLVRNPYYRREFFPFAANPADRTRALPLADRIVIPLIRQPMTSYLMFLKGELDYHALDKDKADVAAPGGRIVPALAARGVRLLSFPEFEIRYVGFNFKDPLLGRNRELRAALALAYDVNRRVKFTNNQLIPASTPIPENVSLLCAEVKNPFCNSIEKAKQMLEKAGFPNGTDPATGRTLQLTFDQSGSGTLHRQYGELAVSDFARLNINVTSVLNNKARFYEKLRNNTTQLFRLSWIGDFPDAENFLQLFYSGNIGGCNRCNYSNPEFDALFEKVSAMPPSPQRDELHRKMTEIIVEDCVWIIEGVPVSWQLCHSWLENFRHHDFNFIRWKYITVNPEKRKHAVKKFKPLSFKELREEQ